MATLTTDNKGYPIIQFKFNGQRQTMRFGKIKKKYAGDIHRRVEAILEAKLLNAAIDPETAHWLNGISDKLAAVFARVGLIPERIRLAIGPFTQAYIDKRTDIKPRTRLAISGGRKRILKFFREDKPINEITQEDAKDFERFCRSKFAPATAARTLKWARQFFTSAVRSRLILDNPFDGIKPGTMANDARLFFITRDMTDKLLDACPNAEWRTIIALCRYGGLRCPSEVLELKWEDINWQHNRWLATSPKTAHTSKKSRWVPLFPELEAELSDLLEVSGKQSEYVIHQTRISANCFRKNFTRIIKRAGLTQWERIFQNLRASRETELVAKFPLHVVVAWMGNSELVAAKHYLQVTDADFAAATEKRCNSAVSQSQMEPNRDIQEANADS